MAKGDGFVTVELRPELRTSGGEMISIFRGEDWIGDAYLVYREGDLLTGTIQVDSTSVSQEEYADIVKLARGYVEDLADALHVHDTSVMSLHGDIHTVFDTSMNVGHLPSDETAVEWNVEQDESADDPNDYNLVQKRNSDRS